jgi:hypothetical protein
VTTNRVILAGFVYSAALFIVVGGAFLTHSIMLESHGIHTTGIVTEIKREKDKDGDQYFRPVITFKDTAGKEIAVTSNLSSNPAAYAKGDTVPLVYKRDHPEKAELETFFGMWGPASMFLIAGIIIGLLGLFVMIIRRRPSKPLPASPTRPQ